MLKAQNGLKTSVWQARAKNEAAPKKMQVVAAAAAMACTHHISHNKNIQGIFS